MCSAALISTNSRNVVLAPTRQADYYPDQEQVNETLRLRIASNALDIHRMTDIFLVGLKEKNDKLLQYYSKVLLDFRKSLGAADAVIHPKAIERKLSHEHHLFVKKDRQLMAQRLDKVFAQSTRKKISIDDEEWLAARLQCVAVDTSETISTLNHIFNSSERRGELVEIFASTVLNGASGATAVHNAVSGFYFLTDKAQTPCIKQAITAINHQKAIYRAHRAQHAQILTEGGIGSFGDAFKIHINPALDQETCRNKEPPAPAKRTHQGRALRKTTP